MFSVAFPAKKKVSLIIFTGDIYFHFEDFTLNSLLDRTTTKEAKSKDDNTEPCPQVQTPFTYFFFFLLVVHCFPSSDFYLLPLLEFKLSRSPRWNVQKVLKALKLGQIYQTAQPVIWNALKRKWMLEKQNLSFRFRRSKCFLCFTKPKAFNKV